MVMKISAIQKSRENIGDFNLLYFHRLRVGKALPGWCKNCINPKQELAWLLLWLELASVGLLQTNHHKGGNMLWTIFAILLVLWLLGMVTSYTMGGFIHLLLILAVITIIYRLVTGRRAV